MKKEVTLKWNEAKSRWDMYYRGRFIMDFPDCKNMKLFFRPLKDRLNIYELEVMPCKEFKGSIKEGE